MLMDNSRLWVVAHFVFGYYEEGQSQRDKRRLLQERLGNGDWSSSSVSGEFGEIIQESPNNIQNKYGYLKSELNNLAREEDRQKQELKKDLESIFSGISQEELYSKKHFNREYLSQKNNQKRESIENGIYSFLDDLEEISNDTDYNFLRLEEVYDSTESDMIKELEEFADTLSARGWHRRAIQDIPQWMRHSDNRLQYLQSINDRSVSEAVYVFFLQDITIDVEDDLRRLSGQNVIDIISPGEIDIDELRERYPYDDVDEVEFYPDDSDVEAPSSDRRESISELLDNSTTILVKSEGYRSFGMKEKAYDRLSRFLDCCSYGNSLSYIEDPQYTHRLYYMRWTPDGEGSHMTGFQDGRSNSEIRDYSFSRVEDALSTIDMETPLAERLKRGLHHYRKGNNAVREEDKIVYYIAAMESLLSASNTYKREIVDKAISIGGVYDTNSVRARFETAYRARNSSIHAGYNLHSSESLAHFLRHRVGEIIYKIINILKQESSKTISDFISEEKDRNRSFRKNQMETLSKYNINTNSTYKFNTTKETEYYKSWITGAYIFHDTGVDIIPRITISGIDTDINKSKDIQMGPEENISFSVKEGNRRIIFRDAFISRKSSFASIHNLFDYTDTLNTTARDFGLQWINQDPHYIEECQK